MREDKIKCDMCGKFCVPYDEETPFGTKDYDDPEPLDSYLYCKKCSKKLYTEYLKKLKDENNWRGGMWQKSNAEIKASEKLGLVWVHSNGLGILGTKLFVDSYQYVRKEVYTALKSLPYYGWCKVCGAKREGGYCSNKKCEKSFNKIPPQSKP